MGTPAPFHFGPFRDMRRPDRHRHGNGAKTDDPHGSLTQWHAAGQRTRRPQTSDPRRGTIPGGLPCMVSDVAPRALPDPDHLHCRKSNSGAQPDINFTQHPKPDRAVKGHSGARREALHPADACRFGLCQDLSHQASRNAAPHQPCIGDQMAHMPGATRNPPRTRRCPCPSARADNPAVPILGQPVGSR